MKTKICTKCRKSKPLSQFYKHRVGKRPGLISARCKSCEIVRMRDYYRRNKAKKAKWYAGRYAKLKDDVFNAYGGYRCACCGETEPLFLTIDHVGNNGGYHRRKMLSDYTETDYRNLSGAKTYWWLQKKGYPPGFQVLCSNCNHGKHRNGGICPHQSRSEGSTTRAKARTAKRREVRSPS